MKNARNFYYRLICACLVLAVIGSNTLVFASSPDDIHSQENNFCQELSGIPIFFDFVAPINSDSKQSSLSLSDSNEIYTDTEAIVNEQLEICESMQLSTTERQIVYAQSPFYQTLERAEKIIADGGLVKGIHFLFPIAENGSDLSVSTILSSNDWRDYTMPLRTYNGYEFRYLDSYVDGETGYINVDDIGTVEWRKVVSSGLKALFPTVVSAAGAPVVGNALGVSITLSDTISPLSVRPNLTYSYSAVSYVKYNAIYRNYMRSFYISDKDNLIPGYDFYIVGAAEKVEVDNHISTRWPTIDNWDTYSGQVGSRHTISTPGFYGSSSFLSSLIQSYQLQRNYYENIELKKELINIILNSSY